MKRRYDGLEALKMNFTGADIVTTSSGCVAMIQLKMENGICISPEWQQQTEYVGDQG